MELSTLDRFEIFEQLSLHQRYIDNDGSRASADKYTSLYWPEGVFTVNDLREQKFTGHAEIKNMYDFAHSVFPIHKWGHNMGWFEITPLKNNQAAVKWRWHVYWIEGDKDTVSTGTYTDVFEKRNGVWKTLSRTSHIDPNWPAQLFQPYLDQQEKTFKSS